MYSSHQLAMMLKEKLKAQKKISKINPDLCFDRLSYYLTYFNSLEEDTFIVFGHPISDIKIPSELKDFILPNSVRYDSGDRRCIDLLIRPAFAPFYHKYEWKETVIENGKTVEVDRVKEVKYTLDDLNYNDWINLISMVRGAMKRSADEDMVSLDSLRINKSFEEVRPIASYHNGMIDKDAKYKTDTHYFSTLQKFSVNYTGNPFVPVPLKNVGYNMFNTSYFNSVDSEVLDDFIAILKF